MAGWSCYTAICYNKGVNEKDKIRPILYNFGLLTRFCAPLLAVFCVPVVKGTNVFGTARTVMGVEKRIQAVSLEGERLFAGGVSDLYVLDVHEPLNPKVLGHVEGLGSVRQIAVRKGMAYISAREAGLWIVDATDSVHPCVRSRFDSCELATGVDVAGDVVFIGQRSHGVEFVDVSNPDRPVHIAMRKTDESQSVKYRDGFLYSGEWGTGKVTVFDAHDMRDIRRVAYEDLYGFGDGVWLKGTRLYAATGHHAKHRDVTRLKGIDSEELRLYGGAGPGAGCGHGLDVFDVSNPAEPRRLGRVDFPPFHSRGYDMWTVRTSAGSDLVFSAATFNGLFAVDCADPVHPKVVDRWTSPVAAHPECPSACIGSVAVGEGCVYVAVVGGGLVVVPARGARRETFAQGAPPVNVSYREESPTDEKSFWGWRPPTSGQARAVAVTGDVVYAACGDAGLHALEVVTGDGFRKIGELAGHPHVFDVRVKEGRLYTAEGLDGFGIYALDGPTAFREIGRIPKLGNTQAVALFAWALDGKRLVLSSRTAGCSLYDVADPAHPRLLMRFSASGWDRYLMDAPIGGGRYLAYNNGNMNLLWLDLLATPNPCVSCTTKYNRLSATCGLCRFDDDRALATSGTGYLFLAPNQGDPAGEARWPVRPLPGPACTGIPCLDPSGTRMVKTCRERREVALYDLGDPDHPKFLAYWKTSGYPEVAAFHHGKVVIPCGYQGVLLQK